VYGGDVPSSIPLLDRLLNNQELLNLMRGKASKEDMRAVLARSVELALDAYRRAAGEAVGTGATRFRCLVCDRELQEPLKSDGAGTYGGASAAGPSSLEPSSLPPGAAGVDTPGWPPVSSPLLRMGAFSPTSSVAAPGSAAAAGGGGAAAAATGSRCSSRGRSRRRTLTAASAAGGVDGAVGERRVTGASAGGGGVNAGVVLPTIAALDASGLGELGSGVVAGGVAGSCPISPVGKRPGTSSLPARAATAAAGQTGLRGAWTAGNERFVGSSTGKQRGAPIFL